ncbi:catalase-related domain-containing protein [Nocardia lasii]|uniref:catalase n=1 Tax=Nocardia lasii TaxID=1616107 RepID=A0ABW1JN73_9NOCA
MKKAHYSQARMFYRSLTTGEQQHVADAFSFELGKCLSATIQQRGLQMLANVEDGLAEYVAGQLGLDKPAANAGHVDLATSPALSQRQGAFPVDGRVVAVLVDDDTPADALDTVTTALTDAKVTPMVVASHGGQVAGAPVARTYATMRSVEFDAAVLLAASSDPRVDLLVQELWRHGKAIAAVDSAAGVLERDGIDPAAPGITVADPAAATSGLLTGLTEHRAWARLESDS